jgi:hypothetical protein
MAKRKELPIKHWSHSSLMAYLRNPLAWYKRYVQEIYDMPSSPSGIVGRAAHIAVQHHYGGLSDEGAVELGLVYLRNVPDFEINFGKAKSRRARKTKRLAMEQQYTKAIGFFLARPPRYDVLGVEVKGVVEVKGLPVPLKAISDLVVKSKINPKGVDIVDHKFVDSFTSYGKDKSLFVIQAIFNYYTVRELFKKPVHRFVVHEWKKTKNLNGKSQMHKHVIDFADFREEFKVFRKLIKDASAEVMRTKVFLPNPYDIFEGENSFDIYRLGLLEE